MGWGTDFRAEIFLNRINITNEYELDEKIDELNYSIEESKKELAMYAASNIKDIVPEEWKEEPVRFIRTMINDIVDEILGDQKLLTDLLHYKNDKI